MPVEGGRQEGAAGEVIPNLCLAGKDQDPAPLTIKSTLRFLWKGASEVKSPKCYLHLLCNFTRLYLTLPTLPTLPTSRASLLASSHTGIESSSSLCV